MNKVIFLFLTVFWLSPSLKAQIGDTSLIGKVVIIETNDGGTQIGTLISDDGREILIATTDKGKIFIPKYAIKTIEQVTENNFHNKGHIRPNEFSHYYIFSPSAKTLEKEKICMRFLYFGSAMVDIGISDRSTFTFGSVGFVGYGLGYTYRGKDRHNANFGFNISTGGMLSRFGGGNYFGDQTGIMGRLFYTIGTKEQNITMGVGGGSLYNFDDASLLFTLSAMKRVSKKILLVAEGLALPNQNIGLACLSMRLITKKFNGWDFGLLSPMYRDTYYYYNSAGQWVSSTDFIAIILPYVGYHLKF